MSFVVEDGTGLEDANSYVTVAEADAFFADRNIQSWQANNTVKQAALVRATDYIEQTYQDRWQGCQSTEDQALSWPRDGYSGIPAKLKQAVYQLALECLGGDELNPVQGRAVKREKVDVIEVEYADRAKNGNTRPAIDGILSTLFSGSSLNAKVVRV